MGATAGTPWSPASTEFPGSMRAGSREIVVSPGDDTAITMKNMQAGTTVTVLHGTDILTADPLTVGDDGKLSVPITVPADAEPGLYPLTVVTENPASVSQVVLKLSKVVPAENVDAYDLQTTPVGERAYQSAVSNDGSLYVTSARGPNEGSRLLNLDAASLEVKGEAELPKDDDGNQIGAFGVAVDNAHGHVWTTNTLAETVTVFDAADLSVVKVFPLGSVQHPRSVVIDEANNRAYVSAAMSGFVEVYDTETLDHVGQLEFVADRGTDLFASVDLALDTKDGRLYSVSRETPWVGWIDLASGKSTTVKVPEAVGATGIAYDPATSRLYVASQETNNVVVLDAEGKLLDDTYIGAGGVSVAWDPVNSRAYAVTRAGGTVAVLDGDGKMLANIPTHETPNHVTVGPDGTVFLVSMYGEPGDDSQTGSVTKITPKS